MEELSAGLQAPIRSAVHELPELERMFLPVAVDPLLRLKSQKMSA